MIRHRLSAAGPKLQWLYLGSVEYKDSLNERRFVASLYDRTRSERNSLIGQAITVSEEFSASVVAVALEHERHSRLAAVLKRHVANAEVWNVIATTITHFDDASPGVWQEACFFYEVAGRCARARKDPDTKYRFNALFAFAEGAMGGTWDGDEFYLVEATTFLGSRAAERYRHRKTRTRMFFSVLARLMNQVSVEARSRVLSNVERIKWLPAKRARSIKFYAGLADYHGA
jgi:hypothetical protein